MEIFTYKGISAGKYVEGELEALNLDEASHVLKEKKIIITYLIKSKKKKDEKKAKAKGSSLFGKKKIKVEDVLIFSKQFATMVKAGLPILQVLSMLRDQLENPSLKEVIEDKFQVKIKKVATMNFKGKRKNVTIKSNGHILRTSGNKSSWKKAIITLEEGSSIDMLGGEV